MPIIDTIRSEIRDFTDEQIEVVPGYEFNQYETIKRIHLYENSQFYSNPELENREPLFFQISTQRRDAVVRFIDIDTKDIRLFELNPESELASLLLQKELEKYMRDNNLAEKLNDIAHNVVTYGSAVLWSKKDGMPEVVDLRNLFLDPTVDDIKNSRFITLRHHMTVDELRDMKDKGWDSDAIERMIKKFENEESNAPASYIDEGHDNNITSSKYIQVFQRFGMMKEKYIDDDSESDKEVRSMVIAAEPFSTGETERGETYDKGEILFKSRWKDEYPFEDYHFSQTKGRWLGVGVMEALFPAQERTNELANQKRISMELSMLNLFQTADATVLNNVLTDLENGQVIKTKQQGSLERVDNRDFNSSSYENEQEEYKRLADSVSHANDLLRGGQIPASTPATNAVITNNNATSIQLWKRENFAIFIREFISNFVLPDLIENISEEHVLRFAGDPDELAQLDEKITDIAVYKEFKERALSKEVVTPEILQDIRREVRKRLKKMGNKRYAKVFKNYFKEKQEDGYGVDVNVDNEQIEPGKMAQNTFSFLQLLGSNPQMLDDPVTKELAFGYGKQVGVPVGKLELAMSRREAQQAEQGGQMAQLAQLTQNQSLPLGSQPEADANTPTQ